VGSTDTLDYYRFTLNQTSTVNLSLTGLSADADLGLLDANGRWLAGNWRSGTASESITRDLNAGTYFTENRSLGILDQAGNTLGSARSINVTTIPTTYRDWVGNSDPIDYYQFTLTESTNVQLQLTNLTADANMSILSRNGSPIIQLRNPGTTPEQFRATFQPGTYIISVTQGTGETFYDFIIQGAPISSRPNPSPLPTVLPTVNLAVTEAEARESGTNNGIKPGRFTLTRTGDLNSELTVDYTISGTATNGIDYQRLSGRATFSRGSATTLIDVVPIQDNLVEPNETVILNLVGSNNYQLGTNRSGVVTIIDAPSLILQDRIIQGTLGADTFRFIPGYQRTVFIGNGNINYGSGQRDEIDLSQVSFGTVTINRGLVNSGGVVYNPGNGNRLFDSINLNNGQQILFEGIERVRFADRTLDLVTAPNDPYFKDQWNLHMIGVHHAWRFTTGGSNVLIGIQDTGLGINSENRIHGDLRNPLNFANRQNLAEDFQSYFTYSPVSHGTGVQGIIGARGNNGDGITGINWNSDIVHIDVLGANSGDLTPYKATQEMINQARTSGKKLVINMSYGSETYGQNYHRDLEELVAQNPDVLFVVASGNAGYTTTSGLASPAVLARSHENVVAVGAVWGNKDQYGQTTNPGTRISYPVRYYGYSRWGSQFGEGLTIMAPSEVYTTGAIQRQPNAGVTFSVIDGFNGTSAAAPHITGVASLIWSVNPNLSASQVRRIMSETAYDVGTPGYDLEHGHGVINADAAVRRAVALTRSA
jgi:hypothetical protein